MYRSTVGLLAVAVAMCGLAAAQPDQPALDGVTIANQAFDPAEGTLTFEIRNDSRNDLVAWIYTITFQYPSGPPSKKHQLTDESIAYALTRTPGLKLKAIDDKPRFVAPGASRRIVERLQPPPGSELARSPLLGTSVELSAVVFADNGAMGRPDAVQKIASERRRQADESAPTLTALKQALVEGPNNAPTALRQSRTKLPKASADMVAKVADQLEHLPDPAARQRSLEGAVEAYELRQRVLTKPIVVR
jgi:hypothetical protein